MTNRIYIPAITVAICVLLIPGTSSAAGVLEISGWIPYWRSEAGVQSAIKNIDVFTEVNPFLYTVKSTGELYQADALTDAEWQRLKAEAAARNVRFIPTIMWSGSDAIHDILSDPTKRRAHIQSITREVYTHDLDGIDIDYEGKYAKTRPYFSLFLKELADAIGYDRWIMCTIESRTPLDSRYSTPESIPADIEYANDFTEINKYCDRVRIMAYDQGRIDLKLNNQKGDPYIPVADTDWVEKVMRLIAQEVEPSKLVLGVATYGYEYDTFYEGSMLRYSRLWSFNPGYVDEVRAAVPGIEPVRNSAGELFLSYPASQSPDPVIPLPQATRVMSWSDAEAVRQKFELAQELGLKGVAIFKVDGGEDQKLWNVVPGYSIGSTATTLHTPNSTAQTNTTAHTSSPNTKTTVTIPDTNLEYGMRTEAVRSLQQFLNQKGFTVATTGGGSPGNETIFFGPATRASLIRFQKAHKIAPAVGYYGPITRATMHTLE